MEPRFVEREPGTDREIVLSGVSRSFTTRRGAIEALRDVGCAVHRREVLGVVGPSGCGKSTLLELVAGLQEPSAGSITVGGHSSGRDRLARCALMPQRDLLLPWRSALDNASLPLELKGLRRSEARRRTAPLFARFGLEGFERSSPLELSGGMRQRVAFLRTLMAGKPVLLLDEPFASLDAITRAAMQEWLVAALAEDPRTVVLVTHDVEEALYVCDRVLVMSGRPGTVKAEVDARLDRSRPRRETVVSPEFAALKQAALEALE